jgi:hypothetical protein
MFWRLILNLNGIIAIIIPNLQETCLIASRLFIHNSAKRWMKDFPEKLLTLKIIINFTEQQYNNP